MNQVVIDSWNFFKNNAKELCAFMLPVFALGMISGVIGAINPQSGILGVLSIVQIMIGPLFTGGLLLLISHISKGEYPAHKHMLSQAIPFWMTIFLVSMLTGLIIGFGFIFLIIPGVFFLLRLFLAPLYVVFQNKSVTDAISTSFNDSKDHMLAFLQTLIPFIVLGAVLFMFIAGRGGEAPSVLFTTLINLATTFGFIFASIVQFRLYTVYIETQKDADQTIERQADED